MMKIAILLVLVAGLSGLAAGFNVSQTADENTLIIDGQFYGILDVYTDEMGYITLTLEPLDVFDTSTYPVEEDPANDPRIGPNQTLLYKKPGFLVTIETGFDPEHEKEVQERAKKELAAKDACIEDDAGIEGDEE